MLLCAVVGYGVIGVEEAAVEVEQPYGTGGCGCGCSCGCGCVWGWGRCRLLPAAAAALQWPPGALSRPACVACCLAGNQQ